MDRADLDIAEGDLSVIALEGNVADVRLGEQGHVFSRNSVGSETRSRLDKISNVGSASLRR